MYIHELIFGDRLSQHTRYGMLKSPGHCLVETHLCRLNVVQIDAVAHVALVPDGRIELMGYTLLLQNLYMRSESLILLVVLVLVLARLPALSSHLVPAPVLH